MSRNLNKMLMLVAIYLYLLVPAASKPMPKRADTSTLPGLPALCMQSYKGISWGWLPDDQRPDATMAKLEADTGKKGCFYGAYSHIRSEDYDPSEIENMTSTADGAILVPSIMPWNVTWSNIDNVLASKIGSLIQSWSDQGFVTYLRFAHEMNCYSDPQCSPGETYAGGKGDPDAFKQAWQLIANACHGIPNCYMFWCPEWTDPQHQDVFNNWWPGEQYVDIVGLDYYPRPEAVNDGFAAAYGPFYQQWVAPYGKPLLLGEVGTSSSDLGVKDAWLKELTMGDFSEFPLYQGAMWFEYDKKGTNFYIALDQSKDQLDTVDLNFV